MNSSLNSTFIVLISNKCNADTVNDFRSISLCNIFYKLIFDTINNRLAPIMHSIIANNKCAFILGRLIMDNITVAHKLLHSLKKNNKEKVEKMAEKLDMSKTYDKVEWPYLEAIMKALGFKESWVKLVMTCVSTMNYYMLVNGKLDKIFLPLRGLRHGDPLSPYLFLICA